MLISKLQALFILPCLFFHKHKTLECISPQPFPLINAEVFVKSLDSGYWNFMEYMKQHRFHDKILRSGNTVSGAQMHNYWQVPVHCYKGRPFCEASFFSMMTQPSESRKGRFEFCIWNSYRSCYPENQNQSVNVQYQAEVSKIGRSGYAMRFY